MLLYAESDDGVEWYRPSLGLWEDFDGNRDNNIFLNRAAMRCPGAPLPQGRAADIHPNVLYTPHLGEERAYTLISFDYGNHGYGPTQGYYLAFSPDGLRWSDGPYDPVIPGHDDVGWFVYDEQDRVFRGMVKQFLSVRGWRRRCVLATESDDVFDWSLPRPPFLPDEEDDRWTEGNADAHHTQFYGMPIFRYGSMLLGFLQVFRCTDGKQSSTGTIEVQLCCSRDGRRWTRVGDRSPVLPRGGAGEWDSGLVEGCNSLVVDDDEIRLYYLGSPYPHKQPEGLPCVPQRVGLACWPRDRFVGLRAGDAPGELAVGATVAGESLRVNADAADGELSVELTDPGGSAIPGFEAADFHPIASDHLDHAARWGGEVCLSALRGRDVDVTLRLRNAEVFSFWWE